VTSSAERERAARAGVEAYTAGDVSRMLAGLSEDVEIYCSPELANPGTFHGHDGFLSWIGRWTDAWDQVGAEVTGTVTVGDHHVVTAIHQTGRGRSGIEVSMDAAFLFEVGDDGLMSYLALVPTSEEALALARERERVDSA